MELRKLSVQVGYGSSPCVEPGAGFDDVWWQSGPGLLRQGHNRYEDIRESDEQSVVCIDRKDGEESLTQDSSGTHQHAGQDVLIQVEAAFVGGQFRVFLFDDVRNSAQDLGFLFGVDRRRLMGSHRNERGEQVRSRDLKIGGRFQS